MIQFSAAIQSLLAGRNSEAFYLVKIGNSFRTSHSSQVVIGSDTYLADGSVLEVTPAEFTSIVDKQEFSVAFADVNGLITDLIDSGIIGLDVEVRIGFINPATGRPFTSYEDTFFVYASAVDRVELQIEIANKGTKNYVVVCTSPIHDLDQVKGVYTSQDYASSVIPGDTSYIQIHQGAGLINLKWGRL